MIGFSKSHESIESLKDMHSKLNGKQVSDSPADQLHCPGTADDQNELVVKCNDREIHKKNPYGLLANRLQEKIDDYANKMGGSDLDVKFLAWLDSQILSCKQKKELPDDIYTYKTIKEANADYEIKLLNKDLPATQEEKNLLLISNPLFPLQYNYGGLNFGIPGNASELQFKALMVKDNDLYQKAYLLSNRIKEIQKNIYSLYPEIIPHLTLNLQESPEAGCTFNIGQRYLMEKGLLDSSVSYKGEDVQLANKISLNCMAIASFHKIWEQIPQNTFLADESGNRLGLGLENLKSLGIKRNVSLITQLEKELKVDWNYKERKIVKKTIENVDAQKPFSIIKLAENETFSRVHIDAYLEALKSRRALYQELNERLVAVLSSPEIIKQVKEVTDNVINLQKDIERKEVEINTQVHDIFGIKPKAEMKDWFDCDKRKDLLRKQYAEFQVMNDLMNSPETKQRRNKMIDKSRLLVGDSIDRMKISEEAKRKLHERLNAIKFDDMNEKLPDKSKVELFLNQFISTKEELINNKIFDKNTLHLHLNLAKEFDVFDFGINSWSSMTEPNAFYSKETHSMKLQGPFLLPEAYEKYELTLIKVLTHEMGHGLDENLPCLQHEKYKIPDGDAKIIKNLELCATPGKYIEDYADYISNDAIGFYIRNNLAKLSTEKKSSFMNEIVSFYCSPKDLIGDSHSSDNTRAERILFHPYFQSLLSGSKIQNSSADAFRCEKEVWTGYENVK